MGIIMSSRRSVLASVSRKSKSGIDKKATTPTLPQPTPVVRPKIETGWMKKNPAGVGMFGSWFDESPDYDEEEDSKTWEQPWALPPAPLSPIFSSPTPNLTPSRPSRQGDKLGVTRPEDAHVDKKRADNLAQTVEVRGDPQVTSKQDRKSKAKKGQKQSKTPTKTPVQSLSPSPSVSPSSIVSYAGTEKAPSTSTSGRRTSLFNLPVEVRDKIYGHLLTADTLIPVLRGWTQCYVRYRGGLEPAILSASRQTYEEGIRILYSTNTFMYLIRDNGDPIPEALNPDGYASPMALSLEPPPLSELKNGTKDRAPKRQKRTKPVAKKSTVGTVNRIIYLAKYAHLFRRVEVVLESNRDNKQYGLAMAKAIELLGSGEGGFRANLTSLQFSLTPVEVVKPGGATEWTVVKFFSSARSSLANTHDGAAEAKKPKAAKEETHGVMDALKKLDVRVLHLTVYTPSSRRLDMTLDMTYRANASELGRLLAHDSLVARQRQETASASSEAFDNLRLLIRQACADTDKALRDGWWTEYGPPQVAAVRSAMEGIDTIKERMKKYRSPWYEKLRTDYAAQPEHACCVRKVGRRLLPSVESRRYGAGDWRAGVRVRL